MLITRKHITNRKGFALVYVVMAVLAIAAVCVTIAVLATNLYSRTATVSAQQQAMIMSKSVAQAFAHEYVGSSARRFLEYLLKGFCPDCHERYQYDTTSGKYKCPHCHGDKADNSTSNKYIQVKCMVEVNETSLADAPNNEYLRAVTFTDVLLTFYLSDDRQYLYGDVTTSYNGSTATTTLVMTYLGEEVFQDKMYDLFTYYNIYLTEAGGASFTFTGKEAGSKYPSVCLYNDSDTTESYYINKDLYSEITMVGDFALTTSTEMHSIWGNVTSYGDLTIFDNITLQADAGDAYCNVYCSGNLTLGSAGGTSVVINRDIYCEQDVLVHSNVTFGAGYAIHAEGNVTLQNANVGNIYCTNGKVVLKGSTSGLISTTGAVELSENSEVKGTVYCGKLTVQDSNVLGSIHVQSISMQQSGTEIISGNMSVVMTSAATGDMRVGDNGSDGSIYVDGDMTINRKVATHDVNIYGTVQINGAMADPGSYPYISHLYGNLLIDGGVNNKSGTDTFCVNYLIGLYVHKTSVENTGSVWLNWSIPVFTTGKDSSLISSNALTAANVSLGSWKLPATKATQIENTLYVCDSPTYRDNRAGNFALSSGVENSTFFGDDFDRDSTSILAPWGYEPYVCLRNAVLNHVRVGSDSAYYNMAVWGGTIKGEVWAHHIRMSYINAESSPVIYAKTTADVPGNLSLRSIYTDALTKYAPSYTYGVTYGGKIYATGNVSVRYGVTLSSSAQLACAGDAYINGTLSCKTIVGATGPSKTYIGPYANLVGGSGGVLYANGDLRTMPTEGGVSPTRTMDAYVRDYAYINGAMAVVHLLSDANVKAAAAPFTPAYEEESGEVEYLDGAADIVIIRAGEGENTFAQTVGSKTVTTLYLGDSGTLEDSLINKTNAAGIWYFPSSCTINGTLATMGNIILKKDVHLRVMGNFRAHMVREVEDATDAYLSNVLALADVDVSDVRTSALCTLADQYIAGDMELDIVNVGCQLTNCTIGGSLYVASSRKVITLVGCSIGKGMTAGGDSSSDLELIDSDIGFEVPDSSSELQMNALVYCKKLTMDNSHIHGSVYCSYTVNSTPGVQLSNGSSIYYSLFAHQTLVQLLGGSQLLYASTASLPANLRSVSASKLSGEDGTLVGSTNGGAIVYLCYINTSVTAYSTFYTEHALDTIVTAHMAKVYGPAPANMICRSANHVQDGSGTRYTVTAQSTTVTSLQNTIKNVLEDDDFAWVTSAVGTVELKPSVSAGSLAGMQNWDSLVKPLMDLPAKPADVDPNAVEYVPLEDNPHMMLGNEDIWNPQTIALRWVFPIFDTFIKAATVKGEQVFVNNKANGDLTMSVAYEHLTVWDGLGAITDTLAAKFKKDLVDKFNKEFDESGAHWWDVFGLFGTSSVVAFGNAMYKSVTAFFDGLYAQLTSASAVSNWAGISKDESGYYVGTDEKGRYVQSAVGANRINTARNSKDLLVVSTQLFSTNSTVYDELQKYSLIKKLLGLLDQDGILIKFLKSMGWGGWRFEYYPSGVFFFESGYVPPEVFNAYTDYHHNSEARPTDSYYRSNYDERARDSLGRWYWGGAGSVTGAVSDCTWTFYTCTDPSNPYKPNSAKDLHIVLPKHVYFAWKADSQNNVRIIGNGRVFLYLQEDTNILIAGKEMPGTYIDNVFGGLRKVQLDATGKTAYTVDPATGEKIGVTLDPDGGSVGLQPRMFIIGTGPNIHVEIRDFTVAAYVYMPNGQSYKSDTEAAYNSTTYGQQYSKDNILYLSSTSEAAKDIKIYGMYVADRVSTSPVLGDEFAFVADSKVKYYETEADLSNTFIYYGSSLVTTARSNGMYRLAEFWTYPPDLNVADMQFYYQGLQID